MTEKERPDLSHYCKSTCGLEAKDVAAIANVPRRTLYDWWQNRRRVVELIVKGIKHEQSTK